MAMIKGHKNIFGRLGPSRVIPFCPGEPAASVDDYFVAQVDMKVGVYTLAETAMPGGIARNIIVTHADQDTRDTLGTITVTGTDIYGTEITEEITPAGNTVAQGVKAFKTVSEVEGADWAVDGSEGTKDKIKVGYGNKLGLPVCLSRNTVLRAFLDGALEGTAPTVAVDASDVSKNTVLLNSALNGDEVIVDYYES